MARNSDLDSTPAPDFTALPPPEPVVAVTSAPTVSGPEPVVVDPLLPVVTTEVVDGVTIERASYGGQDRYIPAPE